MVKKKLIKHQKVSKYYDRHCLKNLLLHFMSLLIVPIFKNSHAVVEIYFIFLKTRPKSNFKDFQFLNWTLVKRPEKYLLSKTNFIISLQTNYSNFQSKLFKGSRVSKIVKLKSCLKESRAS